MADVQASLEDRINQWKSTDWLWGILGALVISAVVLVTYQPSLGIDFYAEDNVRMDALVRLSPTDYLTRYLDPSFPSGWYRPVQGIQFWIEYRFFGGNVGGYRFAQLMLHLANCLLLYGLVAHVTKKWHIGLAAALIYAAHQALISDFFWVEIADPLVSLFYLLAIAFWLRHLMNGNLVDYALTVLAFVLALWSKEVGTTVPIALFLLDRWFVGRWATLTQLSRRYLIFGLGLLVYGVYYAKRWGTFTSQQYGGPYAGMGIGSNLLSNLANYFAVLVSPLQVSQPPGLTGVLFAILGMIAAIYLIGFKRDWRVAFLIMIPIVPLLPVLLFTFAGTRYLYLSVMASAIWLALGIGWLSRSTARWKVVPVILATILALFVSWNAASAADAFDGMTAYIRQYRLPVRSIFQVHRSFPNDSYLYFLGNQIQEGILSGMFALHYGAGVTVGATDNNVRAGLREHSNSYVYYFGDQNRPIEQAVEQKATTSIEPALPVDFNVPLELQGYEIVSSTVKRGDSIIVLFYWKAKAPIDKSYTLFAHLVNARGETVASADSIPRGGQLPTNTWRPNDLVIDWALVPVSDVPPGEYQLNIGWYYLPTMERLSAVTPDGRFLDKLSVGPFRIE